MSWYTTNFNEGNWNAGNWFFGNLTFPVQFQGLRITYPDLTIKELCMVSTADAPSGMGGIFYINKNGTNYAIYLVETGDPLASLVRINTTVGVKSVRLKD